MILSDKRQAEDMTILRIDNYPELKFIFWDWSPNEIDEKIAFALIEKRWPYISHKNLNSEEVSLIQRLAKTYGNGLLLVGQAQTIVQNTE